jgi:multicomponent Na+:H+ antiporter subunit G
MDFIGAIFILLGVFFFGVGVLGVIRLPDALSRLHASGKVGTLGLTSLLVGAAFLMPSATFKIIAMIVFVIFSGPVTSHAIGLTHHRILEKNE